MLGDAAAKAETDFRAMVVANQGEFFCVGANLFLVVMAAGQKEWGQIRAMVKGYQDATQRLKYATVPVVAAPYNMTLGGGLELCFACNEVQAAAETYAGLVEVGVGLIFDLGTTHDVAKVNVTATDTNWSGEIYLSEADGTTLPAWGTPHATGQQLGRDTSFDLKPPNTGRYVLVWITRLPDTGKLGIAEVHIEGH